MCLPGIVSICTNIKLVGWCEIDLALYKTLKDASCVLLLCELVEGEQFGNFAIVDHLFGDVLLGEDSII